MNDVAVSSLAHYQIIRRNGAVVPFEPETIAHAMMKAFLAIVGTQGIREAEPGAFATAVVMLLQVKHLSRFSQSGVARAQATGRTCAACGPRARRRRRIRQGGRSVRWHWWVHDG